MSGWKMRRGDDEYPVESVDALRAWAAEGRIAADDYVYNPILDKWMYAKEVAEFGGVFHPGRTQAREGCGIGILLMIVGGVAGVIFHPLVGGFIALVGAIVLIVAIVQAIRAPTIAPPRQSAVTPRPPSVQSKSREAQPRAPRRGVLAVALITAVAIAAIYIGLRMARTNSDNRQLLDGATAARPATMPAAETESVARGTTTTATDTMAPTKEPAAEWRIVGYEDHSEPIYENVAVDQEKREYHLLQCPTARRFPLVANFAAMRAQGIPRSADCAKLPHKVVETRRWQEPIMERVAAATATR